MDDGFSMVDSILYFKGNNMEEMEVNDGFVTMSYTYNKNGMRKDNILELILLLKDPNFIKALFENEKFDILIVHNINNIRYEYLFLDCTLRKLSGGVSIDDPSPETKIEFNFDKVTLK